MMRNIIMWKGSGRWPEAVNTDALTEDAPMEDAPTIDAPTIDALAEDTRMEDAEVWAMFAGLLPRQSCHLVSGAPRDSCVAKRIARL